MNSTQRTQGQARFTGHYDAASMVREACDKERELLPNEVAVPKWNPISVVFLIGIFEAALVAGFYLAWRTWR